MADRNSKPFSVPMARDRVIRQRNIVLGLVLAFFVVLFFAITVVKMRHFPMPHRSSGSPATAAASAAGSHDQK